MLLIKWTFTEQRPFLIQEKELLEEEERRKKREEEERNRLLREEEERRRQLELEEEKKRQERKLLLEKMIDAEAERTREKQRKGHSMVNYAFFGRNNFHSIIKSGFLSLDNFDSCNSIWNENAIGWAMGMPLCQLQ